MACLFSLPSSSFARCFGFIFYIQSFNEWFTIRILSFWSLYETFFSKSFLHFFMASFAAIMESTKPSV